MSNYKHGHKRKGAQTPTYGSWLMMHARCKPDFAQAADYYERGIRVCERWSDFANFLADMGERPRGKMIERVDNDKGYEPSNCRWASRAEQNRNRRNRVIVTFQGRQMMLADAIRLAPVCQATFETRYYSRGWSLARALNTPPLR